MRELFLVRITDGQTDGPDQPDQRLLVLRDTDGTDYALPVTEELLSLLPADEPKPVEHRPAGVSKPPTKEQPPAETLSLRPRDIQARIRAGATPEDLADEMGVPLSRIEPYAHPVLLERSRIAELARQSHPVREDGPAKLTLWEVLAAAFGARGHSLADSEWDAFREPGGDWIVRISWQAGLSENSADWRVRGFNSPQPTAEALNPVAADLTDPNFVQPVRTLTSVGRGERYEESHRQREDSFDDVDVEAREEPQERDVEVVEEVEEVDDRAEAPAPADPAPDTVEGDDVEPDPEPQAAPSKRRRKAVTPHWEDVLLGVRANTKRPKQ